MIKETSKPKCLRCGKCCFFQNLHKIWVKCRYLTTDKTGFCSGWVCTLETCTHYHNRLGTLLGSSYNIDGCPYNDKSKMPHPIFFNMEGKIK